MLQRFFWRLCRASIGLWKCVASVARTPPSALLRMRPSWPRCVADASHALRQQGASSEQRRSFWRPDRLDEGSKRLHHLVNLAFRFFVVGTTLRLDQPFFGCFQEPDGNAEP